MTINLFKSDLLSYGFDHEMLDYVIEKYNEPHRFYHNMDHLFFLYNRIDETNDLSKHERILLKIAALYHDSIYEPKNISTPGLNEDLSILLFSQHYRIVEEKRPLSLPKISEYPMLETITNIIKSTSKREKPEDKLSRIFWEIDNEILECRFDVLLDYEKKIFKEFQQFNYTQYSISRCEFLEQEYYRTLNPDLLTLKDYVSTYKPSVGLYPGSFNPFHKGHLNILEKSEQIFDKVIVVKSHNPEKMESYGSFPKQIYYRETIYWAGLTTDLINDLSSVYNVTLIRGLRNGKDLDYEVNQIRFMEEMKPDLKVCLIHCDKEYEHISSSAIRNIGKFSTDLTKKYLLND